MNGEPLNLKDILDLGTNGMLFFLLWQLWNRFGAVTDRLFAYLEQARIDRHNMQAEVTALRLKVDATEEQRAAKG